jgi:hypothetical protein
VSMAAAQALASPLLARRRCAARATRAPAGAGAGAFATEMYRLNGRSRRRVDTLRAVLCAQRCITLVSSQSHARNASAAR